jgi:hypothetical protein
MIEFPRMKQATAFFGSVAHIGVFPCVPFSPQRISYDLSFVKKKKKKKKKKKSYLR